MKVQTFALDEKYPDVTLTSYVLDDSSELLNGQTRPAVIILPGGGYFSCSDREAEPIALLFNNHGYHAFVLRYATYLEGKNNFPDITKPLPAKVDRCFPTQVKQVAQAMIFIQQHAKEWFIDPSKIAICGFSAGGHNACMYANYWNQPLITQSFPEVNPEILRPAACILGYPVIDYTLLKQQILQNPDSFDHQFMKAANVAFLGKELPDDELAQKVSGNLLVNDSTPPTFIWSTFEDGLVDATHSIVYAQALKKQQIPFELHVFENGGHGLSLANQATSSAQSQIDPSVAIWQDLVLTWLDKRFKLYLPKYTAFEEQMMQKN